MSNHKMNQDYEGSQQRPRLTEAQRMENQRRRERVEAARRQREELKQQYPTLFKEIALLLCRHNPVNLCHPGITPDEHDPEAGTILARRLTAQNVEDVQSNVHEEFVRWFNPRFAGEASRYAGVAAELWALWQRQQAEPPRR